MWWNGISVIAFIFIVVLWIVFPRIADINTVSVFIC